MTPAARSRQSVMRRAFKSIADKRSMSAPNSAGLAAGVRPSADTANTSGSSIATSALIILSSVGGGFIARMKESGIAVKAGEGGEVVHGPVVGVVRSGSSRACAQPASENGNEQTSNKTRKLAHGCSSSSCSPLHEHFVEVQEDVRNNSPGGEVGEVGFVGRRTNRLGGHFLGRVGVGLEFGEGLLIQRD